jgi:hypothetical protein
MSDPTEIPKADGEASPAGEDAANSASVEETAASGGELVDTEATGDNEEPVDEAPGDDVEEGAAVSEEAPTGDVNESAQDPEPKSVAFSDSTKEERSTLLASSGLDVAPSDDIPFESHFTVRIPTSTLHYRGALLRVIDTDDDQIILGQVEDDEGNKKVLVKRISPETLSQKILRIGYTLVTILFCGFLFVFCFQVLLLLIIACQVYSTNKAGELGQISGITLLSTLLAFPMMLYSMSSLMAMGSGKLSCSTFTE